MINFKFLLFIFIILLAHLAPAEFDLNVEKKPVNATDLLKVAQSPSIKFLNPYAKVFLLKNYDNIYVALFSDQKTMNLALDRATRAIYFANKTILSDKEFLQALQKNKEWGTLGHDHYGYLLKKYLKKWKQTSNDKLTRETQDLIIENTFWNDFIKLKMQDSSSDNLPQNGGFVLLAVPVGSSDLAHEKMRITLSHELLHAQFAKDLKVQNVVNRIWQNKVTLQDQKAIVRELKKAGYDVSLNNQETEKFYLLRNEFYAYLMQQNAQNDSLKDFVKKYQKTLSQALNQENLQPISNF